MQINTWAVIIQRDKAFKNAIRELPIPFYAFTEAILSSDESKASCKSKSISTISTD